MKNLENFYKSIQILVSLSEVWTCNLMITSLVSYPLDHRGKLENLAVYVYFIIKIQKIPLLANEMYKLQTHFGFTNLCSKVASFCPVSSQKVKNWTRTPCMNIWYTLSRIWYECKYGFIEYTQTFICTYYLGNILDNKASVFFFSSVKSLVLSATCFSKLEACFSSMETMLSKMFGFLKVIDKQLSISKLFTGLQLRFFSEFSLLGNVPQSS